MTSPEPTLSRRREILLGVSFLVLAMLVTLVLGEIAVRVVTSQRLIYNIEMVKYAKELKMADTAGVVSHIHRASSRARLMGVDISLNSLGDRGPELAPRTPNLKRVLVLGSSITLGWGVPYDSVFTSVMQQRLNSQTPFGPGPSFEFVNAGIGNYNTRFQHELFRRQYPRIHPDMVVLQYFISDVQPRTMGNDAVILKHSYLAAFLFDAWSRLKLRIGGKYKDLFTFYSELYAPGSSAWSQTQRDILDMRDTAARDRVPFVVMLIPDIHDLSPGTPFAALYGKIDSTFNALGLTTVNTFSAFQQRFGSDVSTLWIHSDDPHPNAKGHALMADALYPYLVEADPLHLRSAASGATRAR